MKVVVSACDYKSSSSSGRGTASACESISTILFTLPRSITYLSKLLLVLRHKLRVDLDLRGGKRGRGNELEGRVAVETW